MVACFDVWLHHATMRAFHTLVMSVLLYGNAARDKEAEDISNAVPAEHPWAHPVGQAKKSKCVEAGRQCARGRAA